MRTDLQPERTALAWQRTALSAGTAAALLLRSGLSRHSPLEIAAGSCAALAVVLSAVAAARVPSTTRTSSRVLIAVTSASGGAGLFTVMHIVITR